MKEKIQQSIKEAMKRKDKVRLETLRSLSTAIQYEEIAKKVDTLSPEACLTIAQGELKKRKEAIEFAEKGNRPDLKERLEAEIGVIKEFLPQQLSAEDLERAIVDMKTANPALNLGTAMKGLKEKFAGQYDSKLASDIARKLLG